MQQQDLAGVDEMCPFHRFILDWLRERNLQALMLYKGEHGELGRFQEEMVHCLREILAGYGDLDTSDLSGQVDRAIVLVDRDDRIVAGLTYDCQEFTGARPILSMVVKHFAVTPCSSQELRAQLAELLVHSFDLLIRSCVEDDREEDLRADMHRVGHVLHMVFLCDADDGDLLSLLEVQGFEESEIEWGQMPPIDKALIKEVDLGMARASRDIFSDDDESGSSEDESGSSDAGNEMEWDGPPGLTPCPDVAG